MLFQPLFYEYSGTCQAFTLPIYSAFSQSLVHIIKKVVQMYQHIVIIKNYETTGIRKT